MATISNQLFLGCPWKTVRPKYEKIFEDFNKKFPITFVIVGRNDTQQAHDLLATIKEKLSRSSYAIFDATGGNANVSLEFGYAEGIGLNVALFVSEHKAAKKTESSIISDLAGKKRNVYKNEKSLRVLLTRLAKEHNYTKQFETFLRRESKKLSKGEKKSFRALCLKVIRQLDNHESIRRDDLIQNLLALGYDRTRIEAAIKLLNKHGLIVVAAGRYSTVEIGK